LKTKKLKVLALILLTATLLIPALSAISTVKAATTTTLALYTTLGLSSVKANGTTLTAGSNTLTSGDTYTFTATPDSGWKFVCFDYAAASGALSSTNNPYSNVISAACSLEAVCIPSTNTTGTTSGSGASTITLFASAGGTTSPAVPSADVFTGTSISGTIGTATSITETPGTGYTFLCWVTQCSSANNYYTSSTLSYKPLTSGVAIEPLWVYGTTVTLPTPTPTPTKIVEYSSLAAVVVAAALVAAALATFVYAKKSRK